MLKKNDQIYILYLCLNLKKFCNTASKTLAPTPGESETMQQTCKGLSKIFSTLEKDFEGIAMLIGMSFTKKEIKSILEKKNDSKL